MYDINKKVIFTHPHKCGGTSIEELLGFLKLREKYQKVHDFKHGSLEFHINEITAKGFGPEDFFKFSIIRNPWSRAVSFYNHIRYKEYDYFTKELEYSSIPSYVEDSKQMSFKEFVFKYYANNFNSDIKTKPFMLFKGKFSLDYIIKLENLKEDLSLIKDRLQISLNIPHLNNSDSYVKREDYKSYYDSETKKYIHTLFEWDIETFKYTF